MTNFSRLSVLDLALAALLAAVFCGCGPDDGSKELEKGREAYEANNPQKAAKLFEESLKSAPDNVEALVAFATAKIELGEFPAAKEAIEKALAKAADWDVRLLKAQIDYHLKDYDGSVKGFREIADDESLDRKIRSQGFAGAGVVEFSRNANDAARIAFLEAIRLDRRNASAWYHLGLLYRDGFNFNEAALEQFQIYVRLDAEADARVQKVQRTVIPDLKDTVARTTLDIPGARDRNATACAKQLAVADAAMKKGSFKTAKLRYQDAVKADALSYPAVIGLAKAWLKTDSSAVGQRKALDCYRTACKLNPSSISTFLATGELAVKAKQPLTAVESFSRAMAADPTNISAIDGLIRALRSVNRQTDAKLYQSYRDFLGRTKR